MLKSILEILWTLIDRLKWVNFTGAQLSKECTPTLGPRLGGNSEVIVPL
jgi:hypothetical protein